MKNILSNKKGVSAVIGYVLLITFAIVIAGIVFAWLRTYVPQQSVECPEDVSIYVKNHSINGETDVLTIYLKNNGKFEVDGLYMRYSESAEQEIAVKDLTKNFTILGASQQDIDLLKFNPGIILPETLKPNEIKKFDFYVNGIPKLHSIDIIPWRYEKAGTKTEVTSCGKAKINEIINK